MQAARPATLFLERSYRSKHNLTFLYRFDEVVFTSTLWYPSVDFHLLERTYGVPFMAKLYAHIHLFHALKLQSLLPSRLELGPVEPFWTLGMAQLWAKSTLGCLGQWRIETGNLAYRGAEVAQSTRASDGVGTTSIREGDRPLLVGNGGGKDSLVMLRLLDSSDVAYDTFGINFHTEANPDRQLAMNERILTNLRYPPKQNHRQYIVESFLNSPAASLHGVSGLHVPHIRNDEDTPNGHGIFGLLPIMLQHGYTQLCFGNERSADSENIEIDGERINHAWSKTVECEALYEDYVREHLVGNFTVFSFLKPLSDVMIYRQLAHLAQPGDLERAYSCNVAPPWCKQCPKCAYVWLSYLAYMTEADREELVHCFGDMSPFDEPALRVHFRQLMGLQDHKPFECVGEVEEVRLAFELCVRKGLSGSAIDDYVGGCRLTESEFHCHWRRYNEVDLTYRRMPPRYRAIIDHAIAAIAEPVNVGAC